MKLIPPKPRNPIIRQLVKKAKKAGAHQVSARKKERQQKERYGSEKKS